MLAADENSDSARTALPLESPPWKEIVDPIRPFLEQVSHRLARQVEAFDAEIVPYARYALTNQGKQLRPVLVGLCGGAAGRMNDSLVTVATIIEMVHLATLVHDDIVDSAELRRQRPTLAAHWGNQVSVLLGDCLFAQAVKLAASFPTPEVCRAVAQATHRVCSGEILQTQRRGQVDLDRDEYLRILEMKTAELFALSCDLGSWLGGASPEHRKALRQYGLALGTAYQIYDDCLDLFGSEALVGKSLGTDLASGKVTLPILIVLEHGNEEDRSRIRSCIEDRQAPQHQAVCQLLERYGAQEESRVVIQNYLDRAQEELRCLPETPFRSALSLMPSFLAQQCDRLGVVS